jgi:tryptophan 7-halogenase
MNIVVVGGGTAGWLTALYAKKAFPNESITLVESKEIGILGAGEGSTPQIINFLDYLNIPVSDLIENTKTTIKNGIKFTNWSKTPGYYFHPFFTKNQYISAETIENLANFYESPNIPIVDIMSVVENKSIEEDSFVSKLSDKNKVPFSLNYNIYEPVNKILDFTNHSNYSIHFDARLLADHLSRIGVYRGIKVIEGKVSSISSKSNGDISSLMLDNGLEVDVDFVIDCTGFSRLLIGKHFNSEWISFKDILPMKKALPFFVDMDSDNIPPYTESIAMNYGWMWKIPLQHRYGCGYVYDSDFISDEDARKEIEEYLGFVPAYPRETPFNFNPGCYKESWIKNCLSVGLSSSFVEPLEATSIMQLILELTNFFSNKHDIFTRSQNRIDRFNEKYLEQTLEVVDFIYLHYITNKTNTDFWVNFTKNNKMSDSLKEKISLMNNSTLNNNFQNIFTSMSYYTVADGLELLDKENAKKIYNTYNLGRFSDTLNKQNKVKQQIVEHSESHSNFLKHLGGLNNDNN